MSASGSYRLVEVQPLLAEDARIGAIELDAHQRHISNIVTFKATPYEVEEWYFAKDPTSGPSQLMLEVAVAKQNYAAINALLGESVQEAIALGRGGLTILARCIYPEAFNEEDGNTDWFSRIEETRYQTAATNGDVSPAPMTATGLLELCFKDIKADTFSRIKGADQQTVFIAAEMLRESTIQIIQLKNLGALTCTELEGEDLNKFIKDGLATEFVTPHFVLGGISEEKLRDVVQEQNIISDYLLSTIASYALSDLPEKLAPEESDRLVMLSLAAQSIYASSYMSDPFTESYPERFENSKLAFNNLVMTMERVFGTVYNPINQRLRSPDVKGALHQILWFMDAYAMRLIKPELYGDVRSTPAYSRGDAPRIGYPNQRRGIDMWVQFGELTDFIQLKSSPTPNGRQAASVSPELVAALPEEMRDLSWESDEYHPIIVTLNEQNFLETNPKRLVAKLNAYRRWIDSGFREEQGEKVYSYVLPSVKDELDAIIVRRVDRATMLRQAMAKHILEPAFGQQSKAPTKSKASAEKRKVRQAVKKARRAQRSHKR